MTDTLLLDATGIAKSFGTVVALRNASLRVESGEIHALLGANGAGKSTLVKILSGVHHPDAGEIVVHGQESEIRTPRAAADTGLGTVFQDPALIPDLTVRENLRLTDIAEEDVEEWLEHMGLRGVDFDVLIRELPLPTLRLLDLARVLARNPSLLMLDEITAALTADQAEQVFAVMEEWKTRGNSVLIITHRLGEVMRMCDRATVLRDGQDVEVCVPREVGESGLVQAMLGEAVEAIPETRSDLESLTEAPIALEGVDLRSTDEVSGVSFQLRAGEVLGVAALEGQGQDRLFELLSGSRRPDGGRIVLADGDELDAGSPYDAVRRGVVLVPSDRLQALLPKRPIRENLTTPLYNRLSMWFGLARDEKTRVDSAVDRLSIDTRAGKQAGRLSGGNQQKVVVGRWLASGFRVLLCFDPTRGIDVGTKRQIYELLQELADDGAAVLLYTSELAEIPLVCDRVLVMYDGEIVDELPASDATEQALLTAAHGLSEEMA
ncbi:MAG TPA: sugar ABC transporter ATP-binding protein [Acidimicrobiia bacterium]|nr:sugar ABC transporter ATP-binding protein [Acidimicrobiia bacterium]